MKIKAKHALCITFLFSLGSTIVALGNKWHHSWQALLVAFIIMIPNLLILQCLLNKYQSKDLFTIIEEKMVKGFKKITIILYTVFCFYITARIIDNYIDFVVAVSLTSDEYILILIICIVIASWYLLKTDLINIGRVSQIGTIISIFMIVLLLFLSLKNIKFKYLQPIIPIEVDDFFKNLLSFTIQPFGEMIILYNVFCNIEVSKSRNKIYLLAGLISLVVLEVILISSTAILGNNYILITNYPYFSSIAVVNFLRFVARIETFSIILFFFSFIIKLVISIYSINIAFKKIFKIKAQTTLYIPLLLMSVALSMVVYNNISELKIITPYYCTIAFVFVLIIPSLLLVKAKNKYKSKEIK